MLGFSDSEVLGMASARALPNLSDAETLLLWERAEADGFRGAAFDTLVLHNVRLASFWAHRYRTRRIGHVQLDFQQLQSIAIEILIQQIPRFNTSLGRALTPYLSTKIKQGLLRALMDEASQYQTPHAEGRRRKEIPIGTPMVELAAANDAAERVASEAPSQYEQLEASRAGHDLQALLNQAEGILLPRWRQVLCMHADGLSGAEIGRELGISRERVRQIKEKAIKRLRELVVDAD